MWILSEVGFIHSGRIVAIRPPVHKNSKTIRVSLTGKPHDNDIWVMRDQAEALLGMTSEQIKQNAKILRDAIDQDKDLPS